MPTELITRNGSPAPPTAAATERRDAEVRTWARSHVERVRRLKWHTAVYVLGMAGLTAVWALTQWQDNGAFERFATGGNPGDWEPWIAYVGVVWGFFLALEALKTFFDRPTTEADVDRYVERLRTGR
jgi:hypothetical protein